MTSAASSRTMCDFLYFVKCRENIIEFIHLMQCILHICIRYLLAITNHSCTHLFCLLSKQICILNYPQLHHIPNRRKKQFPSVLFHVSYPLKLFPSARFSRKKKRPKQIASVFFQCRRPGSNRHGYYYPRDFKSRASANSATAAAIKLSSLNRYCSDKRNDPEETRTLDLRRDRAAL